MLYYDNMKKLMMTMTILLSMPILIGGIVLKNNMPFFIVCVVYCGASDRQQR